MIRLVESLTLVALLAGCLTMPTKETWVFVKPGVAEADRKRDQSQCYAAAVNAGGSDSMTKMDRPAYKACMEQRGYTLRIEK